MSGEIRKLDTEQIQNTTSQFKSMALSFTQCKNNVEKTTNALLETWVGESRNSFEKQYNLLTGHLNDIEDTLYDLYDALVDAESAYIEADESVSNEIKKGSEGLKSSSSGSFSEKASEGSSNFAATTIGGQHL